MPNVGRSNVMRKQLLKLFITVPLLLAFVPHRWAAGQDMRNRTPRFEDYSPGRQSKNLGEIIGINRPDSSESTAQFRKRIREAARKGPNFAGHYSVVGWSCGMICINLALVNVKSGRTHNTPFMGIGDGPCPTGFYEQGRRLVHFKMNSRLLILRGTAEDYGPAGMFHDAPCSTRYYVWKTKRLVLVKEVFARKNV